MRARLGFQLVGNPCVCYKTECQWLTAKGKSYKVYAILDEVFLAGEIQETSKSVVLDRLAMLDRLE